MPHIEYVRVKDAATKHEYSVVASAVDSEHMTVLDKPATFRDGRPLPPKHHKSLSGSKGRKAAPKAEPDGEVDTEGREAAAQEEVDS